MQVEVPVRIKPVALARPAVARLGQKRGIDSARILAHIPVAPRAVAPTVLLDEGRIARRFGKKLQRVGVDGVEHA